MPLANPILVIQDHDELTVDSSRPVLCRPGKQDISHTGYWDYSQPDKDAPAVFDSSETKSHNYGKSLTFQ